jgi:hypothetical protein
MRSPTTISEVGSSTSCPSRITVAVGGTISNNARKLSLVPLRLFISIQWPKSTNVGCGSSTVPVLDWLAHRDIDRAQLHGLLLGTLFGAVTAAGEPVP